MNSFLYSIRHNHFLPVYKNTFVEKIEIISLMLHITQQKASQCGRGVHTAVGAQRARGRARTRFWLTCRKCCDTLGSCPTRHNIYLR